MSTRSRRSVPIHTPETTIYRTPADARKMLRLGIVRIESESPYVLRMTARAWQHMGPGRWTGKSDGIVPMSGGAFIRAGIGIEA